MTVERSSRGRILDVREQRRMAAPLELREDSSGGHYILEGYASTFMPYDCYGGVERGGWVEEIDKGAFRKTLGSGRPGSLPDVQLLLNHEGLPLARTTSGTLQLTADHRGLKVRAMLDKSDPDVQRIAPKMKRGDLNEMSFAFRVKDQVWNNDYSHRLITEVSLQRGDVSIVSYGMNPDTKATLSEEAITALARMSEDDLVELRNLDSSQVQRAIMVLSRVARAEESGGYTPPSGVRAEAKRALEWIKEGHAGSGFTDTGRKRAADLAAGRSVSRETVGRIANYLARHQGDKKGEGWSPGDKGYPSPGRVAWAAWGGDPAKTWTDGILKSETSEAKSMVSTPSGYPGKASDPKPNTQYAKIVDKQEEDTDPSDPAGAEIQSGVHDAPSIVKEGDANSPVKTELAPVTPLQLTLIAALESTISHAHSVAADNGDSARSLLAEAVDQVSRLRVEMANAPRAVSALDQYLEDVRSASAATPIGQKIDAVRSASVNPFADDDDEDEERAASSSDDDEDDDRDPEDGEDSGDDDDDDSDDGDSDDDEPKRSAEPVDDSNLSPIDKLLREIRREKGVPEIHSVSDGLAYLRNVKGSASH